MVKCMLFLTYSVPSDDYLNKIFQRGGFLPNLFSSPVPPHLRAVDWGHHPLAKKGGGEEGGCRGE